MGRILGLVVMPSITTPMITRVSISGFARFIPQKRSTIISIKNGKNTQPRYERLLEFSASPRPWDTDSMK